MKLAEWLRGAKQKIDGLDAELIAVKAFAPREADRSWLVLHSEDELAEDLRLKADKMVLRREKSEPLAYILGEKEFYGRPFEVSPAVLIPRPETEALIEIALGLSAETILEIGTGSGCISCTISVEKPRWEVFATDISPLALEQAGRNSRRLGAKVNFLPSDLLAGVDDGILAKVDVIVANLPYVDRDWVWLEKKTLDYEPELALYAEEEGLKLYRELLEQLAGREQKVQHLIFEAEPLQHPKLIALAERSGWTLQEVRGYGICFRRG